MTEYLIKTEDIVENDKIVFFGPLSTSLSQLGLRGFNLRCEVPQKTGLQYRRVKIYLQNGKERFLVSKQKAYKVVESKNLSDFIRNEQNLMHVCSSVPIERDPWEVLMSKYPAKGNDIFVGNETLKEYLT
jgi:hypothetical protein